MRYAGQRKPTHSSRRGRGRFLTFETLGTRTVLSISNPLGMMAAWDAPHVEMSAPRFEDPGRGGFGGYGIDAGHGLPGASGFGPFDSFGPGRRRDDRPPVSSFYAPPGVVGGGYSPGTANTVLYVTIIGGPRSPAASILWFDVGGPAGPPPPPAAPRISSSLSTSLSNMLGGGGAASANDNSKPSGILDTAGESISRSLAVTSTALSSAVGFQAVQSAGGNLQLVPGASASLPSYGARPDGAPQTPGLENRSNPGPNDSEGGLIELESPRGSGKALAPPDELNLLPTTPKRGRQSDGPTDLPPDRQLVDESEQVGSTDASDEADPPIPPAQRGDLAVAKFDDGGMIELSAGGVVVEVPASPVSGGSPQYPFEINFESGVALYQAFELGGELGTVPVDPAPPVSAPAAGSEEEAATDESQGTPRRAAANLGLGLLVAVPLAMIDKRSEDERRNERRQGRLIKD